MMTMNGYVKGNFYNKETRQYEIKTLGTPDSGAILCGLNVSGKDQEGNRVYGKPIDVKINIKSADEGSRVMQLIKAGDAMVRFDGFFVPSNWTNQEGKEIKGNQFLVTDSTTFVKDNGQTTPKASVKPEPKPQDDDVERW